MATKKVIAVLGATGAQGGSLVRAILNDKSGEFSVRALTRNINSRKAKALAKMGAEIVFVDIDDYDSIKSAFTGAYGAYAVTFFWEHLSPERETDQAASIAKAAKETGLKHVIWSTLEDTRNWVPITDNRMPTIDGKYKVPHLDAKGEANKYFTEQNLPVTFLLTCTYWEVFINFGLGPKKGPAGKLILALPLGDKKLPGIASEDIGKSAYQIFKRGNEFFGKTIGIAGGHLTGKQMADSFAKNFGQSVVYESIPFDVYRNSGFPGAVELGNMFQFFHDFNDDVCNARNLEFSKSLNPSMKNFDDWLKENKKRILQGMKFSFLIPLIARVILFKRKLANKIRRNFIKKSTPR